MKIKSNSKRGIHRPGYQDRDIEIVDYEMYELEKTDLYFRGPRHQNLTSQKYFVCIGAAQTFGCFCDNPYPALLQYELKLPSLNLGYGGAGPSFFLKSDLIQHINQSRFAIVQVMSGRSESNSLFDSGGLEYLTKRADGSKIGASAAYRELMEGYYFWKKAPFAKEFARRIVKRCYRQKTKRVVEETRQNWIQSYSELLSKIEVPKLLIWFSKRSPEYQDKYGDLSEIFNEFPQLVNSEMIEEIKPLCDDYVECISSKGSPQPLVSRYSGQPTTVDPASDRKDLGGQIWTQNLYYPSPEMHEDAAKEVLKSKILSNLVKNR